MRIWGCGFWGFFYLISFSSFCLHSPPLSSINPVPSHNVLSLFEFEPYFPLNPIKYQMIIPKCRPTAVTVVGLSALRNQPQTWAQPPPEVLGRVVRRVKGKEEGWSQTGLTDSVFMSEGHDKIQDKWETQRCGSMSYGFCPERLSSSSRGRVCVPQ